MRRIVHGVTGSIAAYKAADLTSLLVKAGCEVSVVMTADALRFITALPFKTLSRHPVVTDLYDEFDGWKPTHIKLADEADLLLVAPATANTIAKLDNNLISSHLRTNKMALSVQRSRATAQQSSGGKQAECFALLRPTGSPIGPRAKINDKERIRFKNDHGDRSEGRGAPRSLPPRPGTTTRLSVISIKKGQTRCT